MPEQEDPQTKPVTRGELIICFLTNQLFLENVGPNELCIFPLAVFLSETQPTKAFRTYPWTLSVRRWGSKRGLQFVQLPLTSHSLFQLITWPTSSIQNRTCWGSLTLLASGSFLCSSCTQKLTMLCESILWICVDLCGVQAVRSLLGMYYE